MMEWTERAAAWALVACVLVAFATGDFGLFLGLGAFVALVAAVWVAVTRDEDWTQWSEDDDDVPPEDRPAWGTR